MAEHQGKITRIPIDIENWAYEPNEKIISHPILNINAEHVAYKSIAVSLAGKPYVDIILNIESSDIIISPSTLLFTSDNWDQDQNINLLSLNNGTVNISGEEDLVVPTSVSVLDTSRMTEDGKTRVDQSGQLRIV